MVGEADSVNFVTASACHIGGPKGVSPGQKALLHGRGFHVIRADLGTTRGSKLSGCLYFGSDKKTLR